MPNRPHKVFHYLALPMGDHGQRPVYKWRVVSLKLPVSGEVMGTTSSTYPCPKDRGVIVIIQMLFPSVPSVLSVALFLAPPLHGAVRDRFIV